MKGVALVALIAFALLGMCSTSVANPPIVPPIQYEQFCEAQKISGTGIIDVSTSIVDKKIALEYYNVMSGDGDLELDMENAYSQNADKLKRNVTGVNNGNKANLNLYESTKLTYSGATPLVGGKYLHSKEFYGGIGAEIQEMYAVTEMEKEQTTFFSSTTPYNPPCTTPENLVDMLKNAGRNTALVDALMGDNPAHLIGLDTKNTFNGTWGTDATWHKIFYKDIKAHEMFTGKFEAEKLLKFHEYPVPEKESAPCEGIDC
ncbi:MAG: hypothetical protein HPY61_04425 [Methanotrichaceae archaeon]|nr:hypothetical protein [Methanotrichaceae archaeon]